MKTVRRGLWIVALLLAAVAIGACKPPEPTPSQNTDLGADNEILLPTPAAWHDKSIAKGQAEWKPFRKPSDAAIADATGGATGKSGTDSASAEGAVEKEIRDLIEEYNGLVKDGKYTEALDYVAEDQAAHAGKYIEALPAYEQKLKEVVEIAPAVAERANKVIELLSLANTFSFGVKDLKVVSPTEVTGNYVDAFTGESPPGGKNLEVHFVKSESGDWFIDAKYFQSLDVIVSVLPKAIESFDSFIGAVKSGSLSGAELEETVKTLNSNFDRLITLVSGESKEGVEAAPEDSKPNPQPEEPPPKPKKKPAPGG